jgi:hypothetical protein
MATLPNLKPEDIAAALEKVLGSVDASRRSAFQFAQKALQGKTAQLRKEAEAAGGGPPALKSQIAFYGTLGDAIGEMGDREAHLPKPSADTLVIQGRIIDAKGRGVKNLQLRITDPQGTIKDRIQPIVSDSQGYFTLTLRGGEFPDLVRNKTDLFITVTDASGREVFKPAQPVHLEPGKAASFSLTLPR